MHVFVWRVVEVDRLFFLVGEHVTGDVSFLMNLPQPFLNNKFHML